MSSDKTITKKNVVVIDVARPSPRQEFRDAGLVFLVIGGVGAAASGVAKFLFRRKRNKLAEKEGERK